MFKYLLKLLLFAIIVSSPAFSMDNQDIENSSIQIFTAQRINRGLQENQTVADGFEEFINTANQKNFSREILK